MAAARTVPSEHDRHRAVLRRRGGDELPHHRRGVPPVRRPARRRPRRPDARRRRAGRGCCPRGTGRARRHQRGPPGHGPQPRREPARAARRGGRPASSPARTASRCSGRAPRWRARCPCSGGPPRRPGDSAASCSGWTPTPSASGRLALVRRFPIGPVLGIAPFNFPLNLVAHKVAPALAVGAPIIVKPAPATPLSALLLGELLAETDLPAGSWSVLPVGNDAAPALVAGRAAAGDLVHRLGAVGYAIQDAAAAQARDPRARRQRRGRRLRRLRRATRTSTGPRRGSRPSPTTRAASRASRCSGSSSTRSLYDDLAARIVTAVAALPTGVPVGRGHRRRPARRRGRRDPGRDAGSRRPWTPARRCSPGARATVRRTPRPCSSTCPADAKLSREEVFGPVLGARARRRRRRGVRRGQRQPVRPAGGRVHPRPAGRVPRAHRARGRRRRHRRRADPTAPTRCRTAASRRPASAARACASAMDDYTYERVLVLTDISL